jgi:hypothetical protein
MVVRRLGSNQTTGHFCVGFQEIVDLNAVNVAVDNKTQQKTQFWSEKIHRTINDVVSKVSADHARDGYTLMMQRSMVGLLVSVFVQKYSQAKNQLTILFFALDHGKQGMR